MNDDEDKTDVSGKEWYYNVYLKSDEWQNLRHQIQEKYDYKCACCGSSETLNIHHLYYVNLRYGAKDDEKNLVCLCEDCHMRFHRVKEAEDKALLEYKNAKVRELAGKISDDLKKIVEETRFLQAAAAVKALGDHKTKYLAKLQSYFSFYSLSFLTEIFRGILNLNEPDLKKIKNTMQFIKEIRTSRDAPIL